MSKPGIAIAAALDEQVIKEALREFLDGIEEAMEKHAEREEEAYKVLAQRLNAEWRAATAEYAGRLDQLEKLVSDLDTELAAARRARLTDDAPMPKDGIPGVAQQPFDLLRMLTDAGIEFIDRRPVKGALWIVGTDVDLRQVIDEAARNGVRFVPARNGSRATEGRPAWFTKSL